MGHVPSGESNLNCWVWDAHHAFDGPEAHSFDLQHLDLLEPWKLFLGWVIGIPRRRFWPEHLARLFKFHEEGEMQPSQSCCRKTSRKNPDLQISKSDGPSLIQALALTNSGPLTVHMTYHLRPSISLVVKRVQCKGLLCGVKRCI